jgi:hypothetical protein
MPVAGAFRAFQVATDIGRKEIAMSTMEDIFDEPEAVTTEVAPEPEKVEVEPESKVDETQTASEDVTGEKEAEPAPDESPSSESTVPITALHGERDRRQAAERELEALRATQTKPEPDPLTSVFESEEGFVQDLESKFNEALVNRTLNESQFHAEQKYGADVLAEKVETFKQMAQDNPQYAQQFAQSVSPYFTLVDLVDKHQEVEAMKDVDGYKAKREAEIRQKVLKELEEKNKSAENLKGSIPDSLAGDDSKGGLKSDAWSGPETVESIFDQG